MHRYNKPAGQVFSVLVAALTLICMAALVTTAVNAPATLESRYKEVWTKVNDNFLFEDRLSDWDDRKDPPRQFKSMKDAESEIDNILKSLNDKYTKYYPPAEKKAREASRQATNVVSWRMLADQVGYIKIETFSSKNTADEVEKALKSLSSAKAYVIDLRDNGGGLVWQSFEVFALFTDSGVFQTASGRSAGKAWTGKYELTATQLVEYDDGKITSTKSRPANLTDNKPLTILVDDDTASASEALSGALRHHRGAELIGVKTFGKGIMQMTYDLSGGAAVKVTIAYIYQPDGTCVHELGLEPDRKVKKSGSNDTQLDTAVNVIKDKLDSGK